MEIEAKVKKSSTRQDNKTCIRCGNEKKLSEFYTNKEWDLQLGKDAWCKQCALKCMSKHDIKEYFWENNRRWDDRIWDESQKRSKQLLSAKPTYVKATAVQKEQMLQKITAQQIFNVMGKYYHYSDDREKNDYVSYDEAIKLGIIEGSTEEQNEKQWSVEWNGMYSPKELQYLNYEYKLLGADNFAEKVDQDYARTLCNAHMVATKAQSDYAAGRCDFSHVKQTWDYYDSIAKSMNIAACKRKTVDTQLNTSWSETFAAIEKSQTWKPRKIEWSQDDVDRCINSLRHIEEALQLNNI